MAFHAVPCGSMRIHANPHLKYCSPRGDYQPMSFHGENMKRKEMWGKGKKENIKEKLQFEG
jgi:hypothetical protein